MILELILVGFDFNRGDIIIFFTFVRNVALNIECSLQDSFMHGIRRHALPRIPKVCEASDNLNLPVTLHMTQMLSRNKIADAQQKTSTD